jgi:hypothetical protein
LSDVGAKITWYYNYITITEVNSHNSSVTFSDINMDCAWCATFECDKVSFEEVMDNVSEETQTELLFHLDFFTFRGRE